MSTTEKEVNTCSTTKPTGSSCSSEKSEGKKDEAALKVEIGQEAKAEKKEKGGCCGG